MKKILILIGITCLLMSCDYHPKNYPIYTLERVTLVPDSLKAKHREWIKETVRASNQHLAAGDYEDVDETIEQAERTADNIFEVTTFGLRKQINPDDYDLLKPNELTPYELSVLDSLVHSR